MSGSLASRPQLDALLEYVRDGDVVVVWKLDRLGRNTWHTLTLLATLADRGVGFRSLTEGLDSTCPMGRAVITIIAAFAELERDTIRERTVAGVAAARARRRSAAGSVTGEDRVRELASFERSRCPVDRRRAWRKSSLYLPRVGRLGLGWCGPEVRVRLWRGGLLSQS